MSFEERRAELAARREALDAEWDRVIADYERSLKRIAIWTGVACGIVLLIFVVAATR